MLMKSAQVYLLNTCKIKKILETITLIHSRGNFNVHTSILSPRHYIFSITHSETLIATMASSTYPRFPRSTPNLTTSVSVSSNSVAAGRVSNENSKKARSGARAKQTKTRDNHASSHTNTKRRQPLALSLELEYRTNLPTKPRNTTSRHSNDDAHKKLPRNLTLTPPSPQPTNPSAPAASQQSAPARIEPLLRLRLAIKPHLLATRHAYTLHILALYISFKHRFATTSVRSPDRPHSLRSSSRAIPTTSEGAADGSCRAFPQTLEAATSECDGWGGGG